MLAFITAVSGAEQGDDSDGRRIKLDLPPSIEVPLEPGIEHDLTLGLAVQIGGRYRRVTDARWDGLLLDDDGLEVEAIVKGRRPGRLRVRFERDDDDDECDDESPDDVTPGP